VPFCSVAQESIKTLTIGDTLPDVEITSLYNAKGSRMRTADFKKQLLIIDFWATGCAGCVMGLPRLEALQKQFGDSIKVLPVTYEKKEQVVAFWKQNMYTKNLTLPTVVEDKDFGTLFKHRSIPHEIWVYKNKVIGITSDEYVDANNIKQILKGEKINWPVKYDYYKYDYNKPIFSADTGKLNHSRTLRYAGLTGYREGVNSVGFSGGSGIVRDRINGTVRAYALNEPLYVFYVLRWNRLVSMQPLVKPEEELKPNQVVWEVKDRSKYRFVKNLGYTQTWVRKNGFCFESLNSDTGQTDKQIYLSMIEDMNRLMGLNVRWEKRKELVWVLRKTEEPQQNVTIKSVKGVSIWELLEKWSQQEDHPYVFDESGIRSGLKTKMQVNNNDNMEILNMELRYYGLKLLKETREVDKFVFTELNSK